jgi:hypothetical protein
MTGFRHSSAAETPDAARRGGERIRQALTIPSRASSLMRRLGGRQTVGLAGLFILSRVIICLFLAGRMTDLPVQQNYARRILDGQVPFRDFIPEYPPLAFAFTLMPAALDPSLHDYPFFFRASCLLVDAGIWTAVIAMAGREGAGPGLTYVVATTLLGPVLYDRLDIALGALLLGASAAALAGRMRLCALMIGSGIAFKLIPIVLAPLVLAAEGRKGARHFAWAGLLLVLPSVVSADVILLLGGNRLAALLFYHATRGVQIESGPASFGQVFLHARQVGEVSSGFGSVNIRGPYDAVLVRAATSLLVVVVLAGAAAVLWRATSARQLVMLMAGTLCCALVLAKVFSPQYLLFLLPVLVILPPPRTTLGASCYWLMIIAICGATAWIFPWNYGDLVALRVRAVAILAVRNLMLGALGTWLFCRACRTEGCVSNIGPGSGPGHEARDGTCGDRRVSTRSALVGEAPCAARPV